LVTIFAYRNGRCDQATSIDRVWLNPAAGTTLWVDLESPSIPESLILSDTFGFHRLAVEDAMSQGQRPKVEPYDGYLFAVLGGADAEVDFFVGPMFLVTVHARTSAAIAEFTDNARHSPKPLVEGSMALFHTIVDRMVDGYRPHIERLIERINAIEKQLFDKPSPSIVRDVLNLRGDLFELGRVASTERDIAGRLARREFVDISTEMAFRFRDVHDHLVRVTDDADALADRIAGLLTAGVALAASVRRWI
jgi:magnesium transporter